MSSFYFRNNWRAEHNRIKAEFKPRVFLSDDELSAEIDTAGYNAVIVNDNYIKIEDIENINYFKEQLRGDI
jgi:hypothetical protein